MQRKHSASISHSPKRIGLLTSWWFINRVITLIERAVAFKSLFTCQMIKLASREAVPDQIHELLINFGETLGVINNLC